jgi:serine/threonine protein kinase
VTLSCFTCHASLEASYKACPNCGAPVSEFVRQHSGKLVGGNYELTGLLGRGGMGEIYKAHHVHLNVPCVIKVIRPGMDRDPKLNERFVREARLARKIHHPNVALLYDFSVLADGTAYMVWEYIDGPTLAQVIAREGALEPSRALRVAIDVLRGLDAIHRAGVTHRDISPDNILIARSDDGPIAKVIDLGIAKAEADAGNSHTATGVFVGKLRYASPEQLGVLTDGERIDGRSDLYSLGLVLYEMLAGRPAFEATSAHRYFALQLHEPPPRFDLAGISTDASVAITAAVRTATAKDRRERPLTARALADRLTSILPLLEHGPLVSTLSVTPLATVAVSAPSRIDQRGATTTSPGLVLPPAAVTSANNDAGDAQTTKPGGWPARRTGLLAVAMALGVVVISIVVGLTPGPGTDDLRPSRGTTETPASRPAAPVPAPARSSRSNPADALLPTTTAPPITTTQVDRPITLAAERVPNRSIDLQEARTTSMRQDSAARELTPRQQDVPAAASVGTPASTASSHDQTAVLTTALPRDVEPPVARAPPPTVERAERDLRPGTYQNWRKRVRSVHIIRSFDGKQYDAVLLEPVDTSATNLLPKQDIYGYQQAARDLLAEITQVMAAALERTSRKNIVAEGAPHDRTLLLRMRVDRLQAGDYNFSVIGPTFIDVSGVVIDAASGAELIEFTHNRSYNPLLPGLTWNKRPKILKEKAQEVASDLATLIDAF